MARWLVVLASAAMLPPLATAHDMEEHGSMIAPLPLLDQGSAAIIVGTAANLLPNGVLFYAISGVQGGDWFTVTADARVVSLVVVSNPDFDVYFSGGTHTNVGGNEAGIVPANGEAVIVLVIGDSGEGFAYREGF